MRNSDSGNDYSKRGICTIVCSTYGLLNFYLSSIL